jgi:Bacterial Ig domain
MKKILFSVLVAALVSLFTFFGAIAQTSQLTLNMSRDWGYGGFNGDIEGLFSMHASGPADLQRVDFFIDKTQIGELTKAPFNLQFNTDNYPLGSHQMYAIGYSTSGQEYRSNNITGNFVPKQSSLKFILPVLGIVVLAILLSALLPFLVNRGKPTSLALGAERKYGISGGAVCPNCHRPFVLPILTAHVGFSKLAVCPFCGKFGLMKVESISVLREAEKAELASAKPANSAAVSEDEKLRKEIDDSKYQGS